MSSHEPGSFGSGQGSLARCFGLALVLLLCGGAASPRADWTAAGTPLNLSTAELRIGVDASYPPLAATAPDGGMYGLEIDLSHELARRLGVSVRLTNTDLGGGLDALAGNQFDGLLAGLSRSPDLDDRAAFSRPYFDDGTRILALGAPPSDDLTGLRVAVELGSQADAETRHHLRAGARFELVKQPEPSAVLASLHHGTSDVGLLDATQARLALAADHELRQSDRPLESRPLEIALRRVNRGLLFAVDAALVSMRADGTLDALASRWLGG